MNDIKGYQALIGSLYNFISIEVKVPKFKVFLLKSLFHNSIRSITPLNTRMAGPSMRTVFPV